MTWISWTLAAAFLAGCASTPAVKKRVPKPPVVAPVAPDDAYSTHEGPAIAVNTPTRVFIEPMGNAALRVVVTLLSVDWMTIDFPSGPVREAKARIQVAHGDQVQTRIVAEDDSKVIAGIRVTLHGAGEEHDEKSMRWQPWANLSIAKE